MIDRVSLSSSIVKKIIFFLFICKFLIIIIFILSGTVLSKEALDKMGVGIKQLSKDQEESKVYTALLNYITIQITK